MGKQSRNRKLRTSRRTLERTEQEDMQRLFDKYGFAPDPYCPPEFVGAYSSLLLSLAEVRLGPPSDCGSCSRSHGVVLSLR